MADQSSYYPDHYNIMDWLPISLKEVKDRDWTRLDIILISGDAYIDHPSFGVAVIGRILEKEGYNVAILAQPNWRDDLRDFTKLGKPELFFGVTAGNMDSMVNHYTANRRLRSNDAYSIGNQSGFRPDRAVTVYSRILRKLYPGSIIVAGGIEASLRRLSHYDYWDNDVKPSILDQNGIDYLVFGNGEKPVIELARKIREGAPASELQQIPQIAYSVKAGSAIPDWQGRQTITLSSFEDSRKDKILFARDFRIIEEESNTLTSARITQTNGDNLVVVNPPFPPATMMELDNYHELPYTRLPHPRYWKKPLIPAFGMI
ncbi:MAG: YgiQ family radical SAM protein, partial [Bacteroidia bacterium]|nr:YgiQ family radical SAM protein [Bacteroidia bacterium]